MFEGIRRHWQIAREAYRNEKESAFRRLPIHQQDFLPAALSVIEKPASPAGRMLIWLILIFFSLALGWAFFGKIDVVAVAAGKIVPHGQTKVVQSFESGIVLGIYVENGVVVEEGELLIELDSTASDADVTRLRSQQQAALVSKARNSWTLDALESIENKNELPEFHMPDYVDPEVARVQRLLANSQLEEYNAIQSAYDQQLQEKYSELSVVKKQLTKLTTTLPLLQEQVEGMSKLSNDGVTARFQYLDYEERLVTRQQDIVIEQDRILQVNASIRTTQKQREQNKQEFKKTIVNELAEATETLVATEQELKKAEQTNKLQRIRSPVAGVVQQLSIHTVGGVVKAGDPLMVVVPADRQLQVEAKILNKDIGFVAEGQAVEVKLEAFPFTKYGVIDGILTSIDLDSVQDEELGLVYPARISIDKDFVMVNGKKVPISTGMSLSAELKTGKRRIIEFLLSPLLRYKDESLRER